MESSQKRTSTTAAGSDVPSTARSSTQQRSSNNASGQRTSSQQRSSQQRSSGQRQHRAAPSSQQAPKQPEKPLVIASKYKLGDQLGQGSFGAIYFASHIHTGQHVAVKLETAKAHKQRRSQLEIEYRLYRILQGHAGIPRIYWFGRESGCRALVMELLGPSLEEMFKRCKRLFSVKTVCLLALQMLNLVQYLHSRNLLHRDIKPANFVMGIGANAPRVYVIDFGLSKKYINSAHAHVRYRIGKNLTGTPRYASINNHDGVEQSRRDDLESLGYVFLYFVRGSLPWQGLRAKNKIAKFQKIHHKKVQVPLEELCAGFPSEFKAYLHYCRRLAFEESPDYTYLKGLFKKVMITEGFKLDSKFDWMMTEEERQQSKESKSRGSSATGTAAKPAHVGPPPNISGSGQRYNGSARGGEAQAQFDTPHPAMVRNASIRGIRAKSQMQAGSQTARSAYSQQLRARTTTGRPGTGSAPHSPRTTQQQIQENQLAAQHAAQQRRTAREGHSSASGRPSPAAGTAAKPHTQAGGHGAGPKKSFKLGERVVI